MSLDSADKVQGWEQLDEAARGRIAQSLLTSQNAQVSAFVQALELAITRQIDTVVVLPLHGTPFTWPSVDAALAFIDTYIEHDSTVKPVAKYEIQVRYNNGDSIRGEFAEKAAAVAFLRTYQPPLRPLTEEP